MENSKVQLGIFKSIIFDLKSLFSTFSEENENENGLDYYANSKSTNIEDVENAKIAKELQKSLLNIEKSERILDSTSKTSSSKSRNIPTRKTKIQKELMHTNDSVKSSVSKANIAQIHIDERD